MGGIRIGNRNAGAGSGAGGEESSVQTTDATPTNLSPDKAVASNSALLFMVDLVAIEPATGDTLHIRLEGTIKNLAGTTSLVDTIVTKRITEDAGAALWDATAKANDTTDKLEIEVTGEAAHTIEWVANSFFTEAAF